jgi:branched-chain amino acid transport system substrate-binding protein
MKKLWIIIIVAIVIIGVVFIATQTKKEPGEIKIGVLGPLTGVRAMGGTYMRNGLELALEEINSKGGIRGKQIKLIYEDDKYEPSVAVSGFRKLVEVDGVKMVIGFQNSSCLLAVAPIAEQQRIIVIGYGTQASKISDAGDYIFRTQVSSIEEIPVTSEFIKNKLDISKIAVLYLNTDYGVEYKDALKSTFEGSLQGKIVAIDSFEVETTDYRTQLGKTIQQNPQAIFIIGASKHVGMIVKQAKELGIKTGFIASSPVEGEDVLTIAGPLADDIIYPYPYDVESEDKDQEAFREKYKVRYGMLPEMLAANAYDALKILTQSIEKCEQNTECIKEFLYKVKGYHGASGLLSFDNKGDVQKPIIIKKIENGKFVRY